LRQAADPFEQAKNLALVDPQLRGDLPGPTPLHAQLQNLTFLWTELAKKVFELIQENVHGFGVGLRIDRLGLDWRIGVGLDFLAEVALGRPVMTHLPQRLDHGQAEQQLAQVILCADGKLPFLGAGKKRAEDRLHNIFCIDTAGHSLADTPPRQGEQAIGIALKELAGGLLIASAPQVEE
jgi:hypothetical protein